MEKKIILLSFALISISAFALPARIRIYPPVGGAKPVIETYTANTFGRFCYEGGNSTGEFSFAHDLDQFDASVEGNIDWEEGGDLAFQISYDTGSCKTTCSLKHENSDTSVFVGASGKVGGFGCEIDENGDFWMTYRFTPKRGYCFEGSVSPRDYRFKVSLPFGENGTCGGSVGGNGEMQEYILWIQAPSF